jgi:hypothetical protein
MTLETLTIFGLLAATVALVALLAVLALVVTGLLTPAIQLYMRDVEPRLERSDKELKGFAKLTLRPNRVARRDAHARPARAGVLRRRTDGMGSGRRRF